MDVIERVGSSSEAADLAERLSWFNAALAEVRTTASVELAHGIRELRDDTRDRLAHPDRDYPDQLAEAVAELGRRYLRRTDELTRTAATRALTGLDVAVPPLIVEWAPHAIPAPPRRSRWSAEETVVAVSSVLGAASLTRWTLFASTLPAPVTAGVSVWLVLGGAWALTSTRRTAARRNGLQQWTNEVVNDARSAMESAFAQRLVDAQRRMRELFRQLARELDATP